MGFLNWTYLNTLEVSCGRTSLPEVRIEDFRETFRRLDLIAGARCVIAAPSSWSFLRSLCDGNLQ